MTQPWNYGLEVTGYSYALGILGGLLPDIDHPNSYVGKRIPIVPNFLNAISGHRGVTHSLIATGLAAILGLIIARIIGLSWSPITCWSLGLGYASHLAAD